MLAIKTIKNASFAGLTVLMLVGLGMPTAAAEEDSDACIDALREAQGRLLELKALGAVGTVQGVAVVDEVAGNVCGFSIMNGVFPADAEGLDRLESQIAAVSGQAGPTPRSSFDYVTDSTAADAPLIECYESGAGPGTIDARILGVKVDKATAAGVWTGANNGIDLTGSAAAVSGNQLGPAGTMFVGPAGPLPAFGGSGATCMETTTVTVVKATCWWLIFFSHCTVKTSTTVSLTLCGADANQDMLGLGLLTYDHAYVANGNPCDLAAIGDIDVSPLVDPVADALSAESRNSVVVAQYFDEVTMEYDPAWELNGVEFEFVDA